MVVTVSLVRVTYKHSQRAVTVESVTKVYIVNVAVISNNCVFGNFQTSIVSAG